MIVLLCLLRSLGVNIFAILNVYDVDPCTTTFGKSLLNCVRCVLKMFLCACVPCMLTCLRALRAYVLMCLHALRAYALTCLRALRAYVLTCLCALHAYVLTCLRPLHAYALTCQRVLRVYVLTY